jgi:hypothetical protein
MLGRSGARMAQDPTANNSKSDQKIWVNLDKNALKNIQVRYA